MQINLTFPTESIPYLFKNLNSVMKFNSPKLFDNGQ